MGQTLVENSSRKLNIILLHISCVLPCLKCSIKDGAHAHCVEELSIQSTYEPLTEIQ